MLFKLTKTLIYILGACIYAVAPVILILVAINEGINVFEFLLSVIILSVWSLCSIFVFKRMNSKVDYIAFKINNKDY